MQPASSWVSTPPRSKPTEPPSTAFTSPLRNTISATSTDENDDDDEDEDDDGEEEDEDEDEANAAKKKKAKKADSSANNSKMKTKRKKRKAGDSDEDEDESERDEGLPSEVDEDENDDDDGEGDEGGHDVICHEKGPHKLLHLQCEHGDEGAQTLTVRVTEHRMDDTSKMTKQEYESRLKQLRKRGGPVGGVGKKNRVKRKPDVDDDDEDPKPFRLNKRRD